MKDISYFEDYQKHNQEQAKAEKRVFQRTVLAAIVIHAVLLNMALPAGKSSVITKPPVVSKPPVITIYEPPVPPKPPKPPVQPPVIKNPSAVKPIPAAMMEEPELLTAAYTEIEPLSDVVLENINGVELDFAAPAPPPVYEGPLHITKDISPPRIIPSTKIKPVYPDTARMLKIQGKVIINMVVTKQGIPINLSIHESMGDNTGLDAAAIAAVKQWRFRPAQQNGRPVDVYYSVTVEFRLK